MPVFDYKAFNKQGKEKSGVIESDSAKAARAKLREQGLMPLEVSVSSGGKDSHNSHGSRNTSVSSQQQSNLFSFNANKNKLKVAELALITRQLATLLASGLPVDESLLAVSEQTHSDKIARIIKGVRSKVMEGHSLSASMAEYKDAFPELYCATIHAGEHSGHLHMVLDNLADYTEKQYEFKQKIKQASVYPVLMITVSIVIVSLLLVYIVPKMVDVFKDSGHELPLLTSVIIAISEFMQSYGFILLCSMIGFFFIFKRLLNNQEFKYKFHHLLLKIPLINRMIKISNTARYARTFGILSKAGVPVLDSMQTANFVVLNLPIKEALDVARQKVKEGVNISRALKETKYFPAMSIHLIASGESSGKLEEMLDKAAGYQEQDISNLIATFLSLFEPLMIVILGFLVLMIVLAILLPIFQMNQFISG